MASPHVAGAAALYAATHPGTSPAQVKMALLSTREIIALPGDPDGIDEGILNFAPPSPPPPTVTPTPPTVDQGHQPAPAKHKKKKGKHRKKGKGKKR
jgi:hypothetical protein